MVDAENTMIELLRRRPDLRDRLVDGTDRSAAGIGRVGPGWIAELIAEMRRGSLSRVDDDMAMAVGLSQIIDIDGWIRVGAAVTADLP